MPDVHLSTPCARRAQGPADGALAGVPPWELVGQLVQALRPRHAAGVLESVERLALGCVTQAGVQGGHLALLARSTRTAGRHSRDHARQLLRVRAEPRSPRRFADLDRRGTLALAGGVESMSQAPFDPTPLPSIAMRPWRPASGYVRRRGGDWLRDARGLTREELDA